MINAYNYCICILWQAWLNVNRIKWQSRYPVWPLGWYAVSWPLTDVSVEPGVHFFSRGSGKRSVKPEIPMIQTASNIYTCCILSFGDSSASEFYMPTFRNTLFHLHRWCKDLLPYEINTTRYHPKERIQHSEHGESTKSIIFLPVYSYLCYITKRITELKAARLCLLSFL